MSDQMKPSKPAHISLIASQEETNLGTVSHVKRVFGLDDQKPEKKILKKYRPISCWRY